MEQVRRPHPIRMLLSTHTTRSRHRDRTTRPSAGAGPSKSSSAPPAAAGAPLQGLADFAVIQSYLSTAAKWGIDAPDALTQLFIAGPWLPAAIRPG